jgi:hypothetical protein
MNFICVTCREAADSPYVTVNREEIKIQRPHAGCKGGTHCDCQHRTRTASK